ncbi:RxLR effector protein [Phytophthora ramorum]|uniref:RxLR effector protein n=1 Tax=Phytophthora ramorum TaxID=164328 RepID=H3H3G7_PHYRM|nr:RxLR effector protein [Phytophthora ramorum]
MRFYHLVLLMVAVLFASADPTSAYRGSKLTTPGAQTQVLQDNTATKRLLRAYTDDEKRGISIPGLESVLKVFPSSKTKQLQGLLKADETLGNAFKTLGLSKMPIAKNNFIETKMVEKLFSSTNFKVWSKHAARLNKQDPEGAMLTSLTNVFGEKNVATMILLGKRSRRSHQVAKKLEAAKIKKWFSMDKLTADDVLGRKKYMWGQAV